MKPSPYQIAAFTHAAREGSFSRAAAVLGVTQSSVTQHVAKLERIMGTQLFIRRRDGLEMTRAARELFAVTDRLRTLEQLVEEKILRHGELSTGHLNIIANAPRPAMPIVAAFTRRYPDVEIYFSLHDWTSAMEMLRDRAVDVAIVTEPDVPEGTGILELERTPYMAYLRHDDPLARRDSIGFADLAERLVILPEDGSFTQRIVTRKRAALGVDFPRILRTRSSPVLKEAVLHGIGIGLFLGESMYPSQNLAALPVTEMPELYRHCLVTPRDKGDLRLVQSFVDIARDR